MPLPLELVQHQSGTGSVPLAQQVAVPTGLLVFIAFLIDGVWGFARHISVIAHEGAHVAAGWSVGRRVSGVELNRDATGVTTTRGSAALGRSLSALPAIWARVFSALPQHASSRWTRLL